MMHFENPMLRILGRIGCGAVSVDGAGHITSSNRIAETIISDFIGNNIAKDIEMRDGLKALLSSSGHRFRVDAESWIVVPRKGRKSIVVYSIPTGMYRDEYISAVIVILDMEKTPDPNVEVLQKVFNLTSAEAKIAMLIMDGKTPNEIANIRQISLWTVRTQLASIYNKTKTRRQSELVSLLIKISILP